MSVLDPGSSSGSIPPYAPCRCQPCRRWTWHCLDRIRSAQGTYRGSSHPPWPDVVQEHRALHRIPRHCTPGQEQTYFLHVETKQTDRETAQRQHHVQGYQLTINIMLPPASHKGFRFGLLRFVFSTASSQLSAYPPRVPCSYLRRTPLKYPMSLFLPPHLQGNLLPCASYSADTCRLFPAWVPSQVQEDLDHCFILFCAALTAHLQQQHQSSQVKSDLYRRQSFLLWVLAGH